MNQKGFSNTVFIVVITLLVSATVYLVFIMGSSLPARDISDEAVLTNTTDNKQSVIMVPFIDVGGAIGANDEDKIGCGDKIVHVSKEINATTQPLNAAYRELFATGATLEFEGKELTNPIADQAKERTITYENRPADVFKPLRFVNAEIRGDVAVIYLEGDLLSNECNDPRIEAQIIFTAKQFPGIKEVETYLNGEKFDWNKWMDQRG